MRFCCDLSSMIINDIKTGRKAETWVERDEKYETRQGCEENEREEMENSWRAWSQTSLLFP